MMTSPIYPSEFGEEKIREYKLSGPKELPSAEGDEAGEEERKITNLLEHDRMEFYEDELKNSAYHVPDNCEPNFFVNPAVGQLLSCSSWLIQALVKKMRDQLISTELFYSEGSNQRRRTVTGKLTLRSHGIQV
ncbi:uncharacterized protein [Watersipora subatra]|uniref:uncharacterized protein isoform X1 n=1 Tax=Watersipora subatra TaxID=2589382 RepID=UPI00355B7BD4